MLVPSGVANGFQALADPTQYVYCFDREWRPGMAGRRATRSTPSWRSRGRCPIDVDDERQVSVKDRTAPMFSELRKALS